MILDQHGNTVKTKTEWDFATGDALTARAWGKKLLEDLKAPTFHELCFYRIVKENGDYYPKQDSRIVEFGEIRCPTK